MARCAGCGKSFEPKHSRHRFHSADCRKSADRRAVEHGPNRRELEDQIEAMATGREHRALVQACRTLADLVDTIYQRRTCPECGAGGFDDKAWREYRLALKALGEATSDDGGPDEFESLTKRLRGAEVSDSKDA